MIPQFSDGTALRVELTLSICGLTSSSPPPSDNDACRKPGEKAPLLTGKPAHSIQCMWGDADLLERRSHATGKDGPSRQYRHSEQAEKREA
mmetsp:Transcript_1215/g.2815  ORF Transcript_1215/g.2815 Transcript_1215/m.2815 type:complete len:91 (-) Transcript_1215:579-851(-)|eukprot:CAMPEP_0119363094 /NCGR_PEP_ID=MMETSP1334-20130426/9974_1 /TAXON_ID=127549 /ORGANISM="Calcidiscus leptoporus, Strain RCC1130" /LENGTH=90 /DNA_ID=CAMNT_0007378429 /DNA_START=8 /DNA_END=280 /DNA_ORIENTATION=+